MSVSELEAEKLYLQWYWGISQDFQAILAYLENLYQAKNVSELSDLWLLVGAMLDSLENKSLFESRSSGSSRANTPAITRVVVYSNLPLTATTSDITAGDSM